MHVYFSIGHVTSLESRPVNVGETVIQNLTVWVFFVKKNQQTLNAELLNDDFGAKVPIVLNRIILFNYK